MKTDITQQLQGMIDFRNKATEIVAELNRVFDEYPEENFRTIWDIYCYQNGVDEKSEGIEAVVFDGWVENIKLLRKEFPNVEI